MTAAAAAGSLWNKNSWHWEERNCISWVENDLLTHFAKDFGSLDTSFGPLTLNEDFEIKGEANSSVRKGRSIVTYDLTLHGKWTIANTADPLEGSWRLVSVDSSSIEEDDVNMVIASPEASQDLLNEIRKKSKERFISCLKEFSKRLKGYVADTNALEEDRLRRQHEAELAEKARMETGQQKEEMLKSQVAQEQQQRDMRVQAEGATKGRIPAQGSLWNVNSYHWEEKNLTQKAIQILSDLFSERTDPLLLKSEETDFVSEFVFANSEIKGEAASSVRKGRSILVFDFDIMTTWTANKRFTKTRAVEHHITGTLRVKNFASDTFSLSMSDEEWVKELTAEWSHQAVNPDSLSLCNNVEQRGNLAVVGHLRKFVQELQKQV